MTEDQARQRVIRAMCPDKVCRTCGEPSRRITQTTVLDRNGRERPTGSGWNEPDVRRREQGHTSLAVTTLGFSDCGHDDWRPGVVLDPFQNQEGVMLTLGNIDE